LILVTGATGRLGHQVVRVLRSVGLPVRCLVRKGSEYFWLNDTGCGYFFGDLRDPRSLHRALHGVEYVIAAHGLRRERMDNHHANVTEAGSAALWNAAAERGVKHAVFVSCAAVEHAGRARGLLAKLAAERALASSGLAYTILRPGVFAANYADLARRIEHNGSVFLPGNPAARIQPIHGRDVALCALASLDLPAVRDATVTLGGPDAMTHADALATMCRVAGITEHHWGAPSPALRALATVARALSPPWQDHLRVLDATFGHDVKVDAAAIATTFKIALVPFAEAATDAWRTRHPGDDPTARDQKVVHRQFTATVYEPGVIRWDDLPDGPSPRQD
jgi:uncharacterized protein YbjT (DUF2867 family)